MKAPRLIVTTALGLAAVGLTAARAGGAATELWHAPSLALGLGTLLSGGAWLGLALGLLGVGASFGVGVVPSSPDGLVPWLTAAGASVTAGLALAAGARVADRELSHTVLGADRIKPVVGLVLVATAAALAALALPSGRALLVDAAGSSPLLTDAVVQDATTGVRLAAAVPTRVRVPSALESAAPWLVVAGLVAAFLAVVGHVGATANLRRVGLGGLAATGATLTALAAAEALGLGTLPALEALTGDAAHALELGRVGGGHLAIQQLALPSGPLALGPASRPWPALWQALAGLGLVAVAATAWRAPWAPTSAASGRPPSGNSPSPPGAASGMAAGALAMVLGAAALAPSSAVALAASASAVLTASALAGRWLGRHPQDPWPTLAAVAAPLALAWAWLAPLAPWAVDATWRFGVP